MAEAPRKESIANYTSTLRMYTETLNLNKLQMGRLRLRLRSTTLLAALPPSGLERKILKTQKTLRATCEKAARPLSRRGYAQQHFRLSLASGPGQAPEASHPQLSMTKISVSH